MSNDTFSFLPDDTPESSLGDIEVGTPRNGNSDISTLDEPTLLSRLKSSLSQKVERASVLLEVPERPEMAIRYSPNISQHQLKAWRRNSGADRKDGLDGVRFSCHVLANTCTGILIDGQEVTDNGHPVTFSHEVVMQMVGAPKVFDCVLKVYGLDPHVEAAAIAILDAAGFNDSVEQVDPTKTS
jgi:hypothetical protein